MSTQVMYEEDGSFKVGSIFSESDASYQVESVSGKRSKVKANHVILRFSGEALADFLPRADKLAMELDPQFLWEVCGADEFAFADLAADWFGRQPKPVEAAAIALKLHGAPMYFYKRGKGRYQAAPEENLKAALASAEKKRRQQEQIEAWVKEMQSGHLPAAFAANIQRMVFKPDRNTLEVKAIEAAADACRTSIPKLMSQCGVFAGADAYHLAKFAFERFADGAAFKGVAEILTPDLPRADRVAFSIDDEETTEVDDAFSVVWHEHGNVEVGIHIAAPALCFAPDSALEVHAATQLSTVYFPGGKITMLPDSAVSAATLREGADCPSLSLYLTLNATLDLVSQRTVAEWVPIRANLRHHLLEPWFNDTTIATGEAATNTHEFVRELLFLHRYANHLKGLRGAAEQTDRQDYTFRVRDGKVSIEKRARGGAIDVLVAELMIIANATWGKVLADAGVAGIYRNQVNNRTRMESSAAQHEGLGVTHYAWSSSPIRRYVDLVNQRQLLAHIGATPTMAPRRADSLNEIIRNFDVAYDAYSEFQRQMERYWCLIYMQQIDVFEWTGTLIREDLVRFTDLPIITKVTGVPGLAAGTHIKVGVSKVDVWAVDIACRYLEKTHIG